MTTSSVPFDVKDFNDAPPESEYGHSEKESAMDWPTKTSSVSFETEVHYRLDEEIPTEKEQKENDMPIIHNAPLAAGELIDMSAFDPDDCMAREEFIIKTLKRYGNYSTKPLMVVDVAYANDLKLIINGKKWDELKQIPKIKHSIKREMMSKACAKVIVPAEQICNISYLTPIGGKSIVKANHAFPAYRWFQAANLQLLHKGHPGRLIPFPVDQGNGQTLYHMLKVSMKDFMAYEEIVQQGSSIGHDAKTCFLNAAKFSYHVLSQRGFTEITHSTVDKEVTAIVLMDHSYIRGVMMMNSSNDDFDEDMRKSHYIYQA